MLLPAPHAAAPRLRREEWLGQSGDQLRPLLQLAELQGNADAARLASHSVNALRARAAEERWRVSRLGATPLRVSLRSFDAKYSPRNLCMIGRVEEEEGPGLGSISTN